MSLNLLKAAIATLSLSHTTHGLALTNETQLQSKSEVSTFLRQDAKHLLDYTEPNDCREAKNLFKQTKAEFRDCKNVAGGCSEYRVL